FTYTGRPQACSASWKTADTDTGGGPVTPVSYTGRPGTTSAPTNTYPLSLHDALPTSSFAGDGNHTGSNDAKDFSITKAASTTTVDRYRTPLNYNHIPKGCAASCKTAGTDTGGGPVTPVSYTGRPGTTYGPSNTAPTGA